MSRDPLKRAAAVAAVDAEVRPGMRLGLGTGSTADEVLIALGERLADDRLHDLVGVATSEATAARAAQLGIALASLDDVHRLDLAVDGADEIDPELRLIKGLGGAHLREKVVACAADRMVVVADASKLVGRLGERAPLPVEVIAFARGACERHLEDLGWRPAVRLRHDGRAFRTDEGNLILDCHRDEWSDPERLAADVGAVPGVVAHGFFIGIARAAFVATPSGVRVLEAPAAAPSR